mmetsp:Transcript_15228/g.48507  ORF Transcript_15228/g.48507 Transcript_15228/m.48507 type:complete len:237 (-) Transcript_15228:135-845(-)
MLLYRGGPVAGLRALATAALRLLVGSAAPRAGAAAPSLSRGLGGLGGLGGQAVSAAFGAGAAAAAAQAGAAGGSFAAAARGLGVGAVDLSGVSRGALVGLRRAPNDHVALVALFVGQRLGNINLARLAVQRLPPFGHHHRGLAKGHGRVLAENPGPLNLVEERVGIERVLGRTLLLALALGIAHAFSIFLNVFAPLALLPEVALPVGLYSALVRLHLALGELAPELPNLAADLDEV